ncbi:hypothetical protein D3C81_2090840 [compost metagenome]
MFGQLAVELLDIETALVVEPFTLVSNRHAPHGLEPVMKVAVGPVFRGLARAVCAPFDRALRL